MFYQSKNSLDSNLIRVETGSDFSFPAHLHGNFELIAVLTGEMTVTVDKTQYILTDGDAVLVFPNQVHELNTAQRSEHILCIFSPQLIHAYSNVFLSKEPKSHYFRPEPFYLQTLFACLEGSNELQAKGLLYSLCAQFDAQAEYADRKDHKENLLLRIFRFVEEHYRDECSLSALAAHTSYHKVYLSRYFKQSTGIPYTDYVNRYRVNEAAYGLRNSQKTVLEIALECGFDSLRSFNRNFKEIMGMTPNVYRKKD